MKKPGNMRANSSKMRATINQKSSKNRLKNFENRAKIIAEASRNEFGYMVGSGTLSGSPLVKFLADFGRHLGPSRAPYGSQNDIKIIKNWMPKSFKNSSLLWRPQGGPGRPQDGPKTAPRRPKILQRTQKSCQNGTKFAPKSNPNLSKCQNGLKAKNDYFSYINFIFFHLWRHPFPCQKR